MGGWIDLRSDTVTRPTAGMRAAMAAAEVGDDVFSDDPTVNRFQERFAALVGKEASLILPSGTMSNQVAIRTHCVPGDELICDQECHIYNYEQGGAAQLSGVSTRALPCDYGVVSFEQLAQVMRPANDHLVRTRLLSIENTHNRGGGKIHPYANLVKLTDWAREQGLRTHMDGARIFNAVVATGIGVATWAQHFDSISVCFSKGLGCPVGSVLAGPREFIQQARRHRKLFGGGLRQAGVLAAAMEYALDHHIERLAVDHAFAQQIAETVRGMLGCTLRPEKVDTNLVIFHLDPTLGTAAQFAARLKEKGLAVLPIGPQSIRACTHLDVTKAQIDAACQILADVALECRQGMTSTTALAAEYAG